MTDDRRLPDFCTPIPSGLDPTDDDPHEYLTPDRRAEMERRLAEIDEARRRAWISSRDYYLHVAHGDPWDGDSA